MGVCMGMSSRWGVWERGKKTNGSRSSRDLKGGYIDGIDYGV